MSKTEQAISHHTENANWRNKSVYHIYPLSFLDGTRQSGHGNLEGIIKKADYLEDLGVGAIWMSPINVSPRKDNWYDVENYLDIDPLFGDLEIMDTLIAEFHKRDMMIMMDFVPNHTSDQHPWFLESRSSKESPKRNWYHWLPPKPDGSSPNNWISVFDNTPGSAWALDEKTREYYLHSFLKEQPDLNWDNPEVVKEMHDTLMFWMDRGIDAFRIDVGLYIIKHPKYPDEPLNPDYVAGRDHPNEIYIHTASKDQPRGYSELAKMGDIVTARGGFVVQEVYVTPKEREILYRLSKDGRSVPFNFDLILNEKWDAKKVRQIIFDYYAILKDEDIVALPLGNHDQSRVATRLGSQKDARIAAMLQMTLDCIPFIFQGDEISMEDVYIPPEKRQDPFEEKSRDPARTPIQWDASPNAGFTGECVEPWLPIDSGYKERNIAKQLKDPQSMLSLYKKLLAFRKDLIPKRPTQLDAQNDNVMAYTRKAIEGRDVLVLLNFSENPEKVVIDSLGVETGIVLLNTSLDAEDGEVINLNNLTLRPKEGYICLL